MTTIMTCMAKISRIFKWNTSDDPPTSEPFNIAQFAPMYPCIILVSFVDIVYPHLGMHAPIRPFTASSSAIQLTKPTRNFALKTHGEDATSSCHVHPPRFLANPPERFVAQTVISPMGSHLLSIEVPLVVFCRLITGNTSPAMMVMALTMATMTTHWSICDYTSMRICKSATLPMHFGHPNSTPQRQPTSAPDKKRRRNNGTKNKGKKMWMRMSSWKTSHLPSIHSGQTTLCLPPVQTRERVVPQFLMSRMNRAL